MITLTLPLPPSANLCFVESDDGKPIPLAELIIVFSEPAYSIDMSGSIVRQRTVDNFRISIGIAGARKLGEILSDLADEMERSSDRISIRAEA